jgi:hypothetical protein
VDRFGRSRRWRQDGGQQAQDKAIEKWRFHD